MTRLPCVSPRLVAVLIFVSGIGVAGSAAYARFDDQAQAPLPPPKILLDQSPRAVEYQVVRLTDDELARIERKDDDPRYRPIYAALLTRKGLARALRDEALAALVKLDKTTPTRVLLDTLAKVADDDASTGTRLAALLMAQAPETLARESDVFVAAIGAQRQPFALRAAYGALMLADRSTERAWTVATSRDDVPALLLGAVSLPSTPAADQLRGRLFASIERILPGVASPTRLAAVVALGTIRDASAATLLVRELRSTDAETRAAAVHGLQSMPDAVLTNVASEAVAETLVASVRETPQRRRTESATLEIVQLADRIAGALPEAPRRATRKELRALAVQVIPIGTIPEQMSFDVRWFAVEAGKPVQLLLVNTDAMPHNVVLTRPGTVRDVGMAAMNMPLSADPSVKAYVPAMAAVMQATRLVNEGEREALTFTAPPPGEYPFACTFPGHFLRMYGVMLVVPDLDAWESRPTVPTDPMTGQPFISKRY